MTELSLDDELILILVEADRYPLGAIVKTNSPDRLRQKLYKIMAETKIYFTLSIPSTNGELWLVKKKSHAIT